MARARVTAETTIAAALAADPTLVERLIQLAPVFRKLKNPILRRTMARLATFADAARVSGVPLPTLLAVANGTEVRPGHEAVGARPEGAAAPASPAPDWVVSLDRGSAASLDVRPLLASGEDPFAMIMGVVAKLAPGGILALDAPFDPAPLRRVLGGKGFVEYAEQLAGDHWRVYFRKPTRSTAPAPAPPSEARIWHENGIAHIDVRGLNPPEPMLAILRLLGSGECGATVIVHHEREPLFLYAELSERGWTHELVPGEADEVRLRLTRTV